MDPKMVMISRSVFNKGAPTSARKRRPSGREKRTGKIRGLHSHMFISEKAASALGKICVS